MEMRLPRSATTRARRALAGLLGLLLVAAALPAVPARGSAPEMERAPGGLAQLRTSGLSSSSRVGRATASRRAQRAAFVVSYDDGFAANPAARAAFQYAVDVWSDQISSPTSIVVDAHWAPLDPGVIGQAGAVTAFRNFPGAPYDQTWYPVALANRLAGRDLDPDRADVTATFSSAMPWYFGTDGRTPAGQVDFVSVVLHELGHGLGFVGAARVSSDRGYYTFPPTSYPLAYDRYVASGSGAWLLGFPDGSAGLAGLLTGNDLYFGGARAAAANGGNRPRLYAPPIWAPGTSYAHLDEQSYPPGDANSLMTPFLDYGESVHDPGPIARGILADLGWSDGQSTAPGAPAVPGSALIGPAGGRLTVAGRVIVEVPAAAVAADTLFAFAPAPLPATAAGTVPTAAFVLTVSPSGASPFGREVTLELPYDPAALTALGVDAGSLAVAVVRPDGTLERLPTEVDAAARVARAQTIGAGDFALVGQAGAGGTHRVVVPVVARGAS